MVEPACADPFAVGGRQDRRAFRRCCDFDRDLGRVLRGASQWPCSGAAPLRELSRADEALWRPVSFDGTTQPGQGVDPASIKVHVQQRCADTDALPHPSNRPGGRVEKRVFTATQDTRAPFVFRQPCCNGRTRRNGVDRVGCTSPANWRALDTPPGQGLAYLYSSCGSQRPICGQT